MNWKDDEGLAVAWDRSVGARGVSSLCLEDTDLGVAI